MKISLGPVLFNWNADTWRDFYFRIADEAPVDTVFVGETVCSKRAPFFEQALPDVIERLDAAGKEVIISTLSLIMTQRESNMVRDICTDDTFKVEANDIAAASWLKGRAHAIGPLINVYNGGTLSYLAGNGADHVTFPVELPAKSISHLAKAQPGIRLEVQAFGRLPLAVSARCYHARTHGLAKDNCQFVCDRDMDGLVLDTLDDEAFLAVNGIQTMSYAYANLAGDLELLSESGVNGVRLSPHDTDMVAVAKTFRRALDGDLAPTEAALSIVDTLDSHPTCNGYLHGLDGHRFHASS